MNFCCCTLSGTKACENCTNNPKVSNQIINASASEYNFPLTQMPQEDSKHLEITFK